MLLRSVGCSTHCSHVFGGQTDSVAASRFVERVESALFSVGSGSRHHEVDLGRQQPRQCRRADQQQRRAEEQVLLHGVGGVHVARDEHDPDGARHVHADGDELRFVEVAREVPGLERVHSGDEHQCRVVAQTRGQSLEVGVAAEDGALLVFVVGYVAGRLRQNPEQRQADLHRNHPARRGDLGLGTDEGRPRRGGLGRPEDAVNAVRAQQHRRVTHRHGNGAHEATGGAKRGLRFPKIQESGHVTGKHARDQDRAKFFGSGFDHQVLLVNREEHCRHERR